MSGPRSGLRVRSGYGKLTYAQKVERRICVRCHAGRLPEEIYARCDACLDVISKKNHARYVKGGGRAQKRRYYKENRTDILAAHAERRLDKKLSGECYDCPNPCREDALRCDSCSAKCSKRAAERASRKEAA